MGVSSKDPPPPPPRKLYALGCVGANDGTLGVIRPWQTGVPWQLESGLWGRGSGPDVAPGCGGLGVVPVPVTFPAHLPPSLEPVWVSLAEVRPKDKPSRGRTVGVERTPVTCPIPSPTMPNLAPCEETEQGSLGLWRSPLSLAPEASDWTESHQRAYVSASLPRWTSLGFCWLFTSPGTKACVQKELP